MRLVLLMLPLAMAANVTEVCTCMPASTQDVGNQTAAGTMGVSQNKPGDLKAFIAALLLNSLMVAGCLVGFTLLRMSFPLIYSHNMQESKEPLTSTQDGGSRCAREIKGRVIDWFFWSFRTTTEEAADRAGLDAALLRDFCTLGAAIMAVIGIPMCCIIIPINSSFGEVDVGEQHLNEAEMAKIKENHPWLYFVHAILVWLVCFAVHFLLDRAQARFLKVRVRWLENLPAPRSTTVLVENIPGTWRSDEKLKEFFGKIFSQDEVLGSHMVKREEELARLVAKREKLLALRRQAELTYEKTEKVHTFRPNFCGSKVETLPYCEENLRGLDDEIRKLRIEEAEADPTARSSHCGFVTFKSRRVAEIAQSLQISADRQEWKVSGAPVPCDIRWEDLRKSRSRQLTSQFIGTLCVLGLYIFFLPIVTFITNLGKMVPNLGPLQPVWDGFAPTLGLTIFISLLPTVLMIIFRSFFTLKADAFSQHKLQFWYFLFQLIFVVLVTAVGQSVADQVIEMLKHPDQVSDTLGEKMKLIVDNLPNSSHFYMTYLVLQWTRHAMEMLRYMPLSKFLLFRAIFTPEEAKDMAEPEDQDCYGFGARNVNLAVNLVLGLIFCSISPLVTILAMVDLILARITYGYLAIYAETKKPDLGGVFWVTQLQFVHVAMALYCLLMIFMLQHKSDSYAWAIAAPSLLFVMWSAWHIDRAYQWRKLPFQEVAFSCEDNLEKDTSDLTGQCYVQPELASADSVTVDI